MRYCRNIPTRREEGLECTLDYYSYNDTTNTSCVNWNQYYTNCSAGEHNPFKGAINFDNIGYAWIAIFQVSTASRAFLSLLIVTNIMGGQVKSLSTCVCRDQHDKTGCLWG